MINYEHFAEKFLSKHDPKLKKRDGDQAVGNLISSMLSATPRYDPTKSKFTTFMYAVCKLSLMKFKNREGRFYNRHHLSGDMMGYDAGVLTSLASLEREETLGQIRSSSLSSKTKEIVLAHILGASKEELSERFGITRQGISFHMMSAQKYLGRRGISI